MSQKILILEGMYAIDRNWYSSTIFKTLRKAVKYSYWTKVYGKRKKDIPEKLWFIKKYWRNSKSFKLIKVVMEIILSVEFYAIFGLHLHSHPSPNVLSDRTRISITIVKPKSEVPKSKVQKSNSFNRLPQDWSGKIKSK